MMAKTLDKLDDGIYEIKNGQVKPVTKPLSGFGKQIITWQNGKVTHKEVSFTER